MVQNKLKLKYVLVFELKSVQNMATKIWKLTFDCLCFEAGLISEGNFTLFPFSNNVRNHLKKTVP